MTWTHKVTWSEGLFLRPQLFQQQERYLESHAHQRALPLSPFYWGFGQLQIDPMALGLGKLVLARASGLFQDGTPFDVPGQAPPPAPLSLQSEHQGQTIHLALPIRMPNSEETSFEPSPSSTARHTVFDAEIRDANSIGLGSQCIQLSQLRLVLLPERELGGGWMSLPVARVAALHADGRAELDADFIAPVHQLGASERLTQWFSQLQATLLQRREQLAARLTGSHGQAAEISDFHLLQILNRVEPQLEHLLHVRESTPEAAYLLLRSLAGELATFLRPHTRRLGGLPLYEHRDPQRSFKALVEETRELLNNLLVRSAQAIELQAKPHGMYLASLDPAELQSFGHVVLAVAAELPDDQLAQQFLAHAKLAPSDRLAELVRLHLPGLGLRLLPVPPRQIPFHAGHVYFQIDARGPHWEHLRAHGGIGLHLAKPLAGLQLQLWGVRA